MELNEAERAFTERARHALRRSERTLDAETVARLSAARAQAVAAARKPQWTMAWAMPAGAVAAGLLVFALLPRPMPVAEAPGIEALEILADELGPEFYQDLEFYEWLDATGTAA